MYVISEEIMAKKVKLQDIADYFNISCVTVSKALSDQKGVSEELRNRIKAYATELGYQSPTEIKMSQINRSYNMGVIVSEKYFARTQSFYWVLYQELATIALAKECFTVLEILPHDNERNLIKPKLLEDKRIDGLIVLGSLSSKYINMIEQTVKLPYIFLDFYSKSGLSDSIISDSFYGMYKLVSHLIENGHRDIAYVGTLMSTKSINDRYFGYCKACMENGIKVDNMPVIQDRLKENGEIFLPENFRLPEKLPTAFACNCDTTAEALVEALKLRNVRVPEDVSIVGFDNYSANSGRHDITTYEVDVHEMARKTIATMIKKISGERYKKGNVIVEGKIIYKTSVEKINW